ncbi:DUF6340 family protein [Pontibacter roseus]|uniref:DUF6340 family protein n=1 Tax=Pontibacter roseus TaxID=336989 RepID=UPI00036F06FB|nr:DUF6340 family protein [Pontibacter roseus]
MQKIKFSGFVFGLLCLQLAGCTSSLLVEATQPPAVTVKQEQWKVLVVNRYDATLLPYKQDRKVELYQKGANQAVAGAMGAVFNDSTFVLVNEDSAVAAPSPLQSPSLTAEQVRDLYSRYPCHLILTLDNLDAYMDREVETAVDEDGDKMKTAHFTLKVVTNWTLYDSTGAVLDKAALKVEDYYESRTVVSGLLAIGPAMANAGPVVNKLAVESGYRYWDRLYPQTALLHRKVHTIGPLSASLGHLYTQQWQLAIEVLLPLASNQEFKHYAKAAHNLAVAYEAVGNYEQATRWAMEAVQKGDKLAALLLQEWAASGRKKAFK